jgi:hypothetical protein
MLKTAGQVLDCDTRCRGVGGRARSTEGQHEVKREERKRRDAVYSFRNLKSKKENGSAELEGGN